MRRLAAVLLLATPALAQDPTGADLVLSPRRRALVIGAGNYEKYGKLRYAGRDATALAELLEERFGFEVTLLHDGERESGEHPADYRDRLPTASVILDRLDGVIDDAARNATDLFLFYYCGHGEGRAEDDVLIPTDTREGSEDTLALSVKDKVVGRLKEAGMRNSVVLIDACRAGEANFGEDLVAVGDGLRMAVLLGCQPGQVSYEDGVVGHGVFTQQLIEALESEELYQARTGGLWFSDLADRVARGAQEATLRETPPQRPQALVDARRDVLIDARLPADLSQTLRITKLLDLEPTRRYPVYAGLIQQLWERSEVDLAIQLFEVVEQLGPLPAEMALNLAALHAHRGDARAAGRVYADLRGRAADSYHGLIAAVLDNTGALTIAERAQAAIDLSQLEVQLGFDHFVLMLELQVAAGNFALVRAWAQDILPRIPPAAARERLLIESMIALHDGRAGDTLRLLQQAEQEPGSYPSDQELLRKQLTLCVDIGRYDLSLALAEQALERWPGVGGWRLYRAASLRKVARTQDDLEEIHAEIVRALDEPLSPAEILEATYLDGGRALRLADRLNELAAEFPDAWQTSLAAAFASQGEDLKPRIAAAAVLAPNPTHVYLAAIRMTHDGIQDRLHEIMSAPEEERPSWTQVQASLERETSLLYDRLSGLAPAFRGEAQAWSLLQDLAQMHYDHEGFVRRFEAEFGGLIDQRELATPLVAASALSYLATGRHERFRQLKQSLRFDTVFTNDLLWAEAAYLAASGEFEAARAAVEAAPAAPSEDLVGLDVALRAYLAAVDGALVEAHALLFTAPIYEPYSLPFILLTYAELEAWDHAAPLWGVMDLIQPEGAVFAWVAAAAAERTDGHLLRLAAYMPGSPLVRTVTYASPPDLDAFQAAYAFEVDRVQSARELGLEGCTLYLRQTRRGRMSGELVDSSEERIASLSGTVDEYGNFEGQLEGEEVGTLTALAKLAPWERYAGFGDQGQLFVLYHEDGGRSQLIGRPLEDE